MHGIHGLPHWQRVERNGLYLAACGDADSTVISLFALFHDSRRFNDNVDPGHGMRGGELAQEMFERGRLPIREVQLSTLMFACEHHTDEHFSDDPTIACCWDADRLDLPRVGILTESHLLNTHEARRIADTQDYAAIENAEFEFNRGAKAPCQGGDHDAG